MQREEVKELSIAIITSALSARTIDDTKDRSAQFGSDFMLLLKDCDGTDIVMLTSLLADISSSLVEALATLLETSPEDTMAWFAQRLLAMPLAGEEE